MGLLKLLLAIGTLFCLRANGQGFSWSEVSNQGALQSGDGTFYGAGQDSQGTCSFSQNFANTNSLPWTTGAALTLALNDAQFANSAACGLCIMYRGTGAGLGTTPIPSSWTLGFVNNRCPECSKGDLDQATSGDGRWKVQWYAVPCNVGSSPLYYNIVVSSSYWFSLVVSNTRVPITAVSVNIGGSWLNLQRTNNNQWPYYNTNGPWMSSLPMGIRVTNCLGETVQDTITSMTGNMGTVQFSATGSGGGIPATSNTTSSYTASPPAYPGSLSPPTASPPVVATPPLVANPPAAPPSPSAQLPQGNFYIEDYQQCGGSGNNCNNVPYTSAPCTDAAWAKATCRSANFVCSRYDATLYTCVPNYSITYPPPMVFTAPPTLAPGSFMSSPPQAALPSTTQVPASSVSTPPYTTGTPPPTTGTPPPTTGTPPPTTGTPPPPSPPTGSPPPSPPTAATPPPPSPVTTSTPPPPTPTAIHYFTVQTGSQCGGTQSCDPVGQPTDKVTCNNGPWAGASCADGSTCQPDPGPLIWSCKAASVATGGRRLLSSS